MSCQRLNDRTACSHLLAYHRTGLPISTYFSAIKLRWMIDHYPEVAQAHESDDLLFGTVESWIGYVGRMISSPCLISCDL